MHGVGLGKRLSHLGSLFILQPHPACQPPYPTVGGAEASSEQPLLLAVTLGRRQAGAADVCPVPARQWLTVWVWVWADGAATCLGVASSQLSYGALLQTFHPFPRVVLDPLESIVDPRLVGWGQEASARDSRG